MRRKPNQIAEFIRVEPGLDGFQWATFRFPCGHDRQEQYARGSKIPETRKLFHECTAQLRPDILPIEI